MENSIFNGFWTESDRQRLAIATNFQELADIAVTSILPRMALVGRPIVEVCGPITTGGLGCKWKNLRRFRQAILFLTEKGNLVFDPVLFEERIGHLANDHHRRGVYCEEILTVFYAQVFESGYISQAKFLPGWQSSHGATFERVKLTSLSIPIEDLSTQDLELIDRIGELAESTSS